MQNIHLWGNIATKSVRAEPTMQLNTPVVDKLVNNKEDGVKVVKHEPLLDLIPAPGTVTNTS
jgi:hypothetical protein